MLKRLVRFCLLLAGIYALTLGLLYHFQAKLFFVPSKLEESYRYPFKSPFEEINITSEDGTRLNGLHFSHPYPKGAIVFYHGNSDALDRWGFFAESFSALGYEVYVFSYRGFGKSGGEVESESQLFADADAVAEYVLQYVNADRLTFIGYSMGSGLATRAAAKFKAKNLVLIAPYYTLAGVAREKVPFVPEFLIKFKIPTAEFIRQSEQANITLIHGEKDLLIDISNGRRLAKRLKADDQFFALDADHNDILLHPQFWRILRERL